jgi:DNA-binding response OmpR family regulator
MSERRKKILIVDDDADLRNLLAVRLRERYDIAFAADCVSAVTVVRREQPDLILLDIGLPGGEGFLVMERLQAIAALAWIPVIVLTARVGDELERRALSLGARAFFRKPFQFAPVAAAIEDALGVAA